MKHKSKEIAQPEKIFSLTKQQLFGIYKQGEWNMDSDGCQIDDSVENFEEILEEIENAIPNQNVINAENFYKKD